jgi:hypothetical protein
MSAERADVQPRAPSAGSPSRTLSTLYRRRRSFGMLGRPVLIMTTPTRAHALLLALVAAAMFVAGCLFEIYAVCPSCGRPVDQDSPYLAGASVDGAELRFDSSDCMSRFLAEEDGALEAWITDPASGARLVVLSPDDP